MTEMAATAVTESSSSFCKGMMKGGGMTMYMDGFKFTFFNPSASCLNFFYAGFTLDSKLKFLIAMAIVLCLGISVEGIASLKRRYISGVRKKHYENATNSDSNNSNSENMVKKAFARGKYILSAFQATQAFIGYLLMLCAMTYSIEIIICTVLGLALGFLIFGRHQTILSPSFERVEICSEDGDTGAATPCCDLDYGTKEGIHMTTYPEASFEYIPVPDVDANDERVFTENSSSLLLRRTSNGGADSLNATEENRDM